MTIAIDNQAAITATTNHRSAPGQQITDVFLIQMTEIARRHRGVPIKIHWIPGHKGILGNEEADRLAKQAAKQQGVVSPITPHILHSPLPHSKTACKANFSKHIKEAAHIDFQKSTRFNRIHAIDPKAPSHDYRKLTEGLTRCQSGILMQLHTRHVQLNQHLHKIGTTVTPICPACKRKEETVHHYLLSSIAHVQHCQVLINTLWRNALNISKLLSNPTCIPHTLNYVNATQ